MKKKILPIVALSAILSLGVGSLASCGENTSTPEPEQQQPEKVEVPVNYYGVSVTNANGVTIKTDKTSVKKGETVTATVTLAEGTTFRGLKADGIIFTEVTKDSKYTFVMPDHAVSITADADAPVVPPIKEEVEVEVPVNYYGISLVNEKGVTLTSDKVSAKKGETVKITATVATGATLRGLVADGVTFTEGTDANTWTFVMPDKSVTITVDADAPESEKVEVDVHHYAVVWTDVEGVTVDAPDEAKVGETVTIKTTVAEGAGFTVTKLDASEYNVNINAGETAGTWTFTMPNHSVAFKIITEVTKYPITLVGVDTAKADVKITNDKYDPNAVVTEAAPDERLYIVSTLAEGSTSDIASVLVNGVAIPKPYSGWAFDMPAGACEITIGYSVSTTLNSSTNPLFTTTNSTAPNYDTAEYTIVITQDYSPLQPLGGTIAWPTAGETEYNISIMPNTNRPTQLIKSLKLGDVEIPLTFAEGEYTGTFTTGKEAQEFSFALEPAPAVTEFALYSDELGELSYVGEGELPSKIADTDTLYLEFAFGYEKYIDDNLSGAFDADGNKIASFTGEAGYASIEISGATSNITLRAVTISALEYNNIAGGWRCAESLSGTKNNSLKILSSGTFTLETDDKDVVTGQVFSEMMGIGSSVENISFQKVDKLLVVTVSNFEAGTSEVFPFLPVDDFGTMTFNAPVLNSETNDRLACVAGVWFYSDMTGIRTATTKKTTVSKDDVFEVTDQYEETIKYRYDGSKLHLPGAEAGTYTGHTSSVTLDGHGFWGDSDHTYVYDEFLGTVRLKYYDEWEASIDPEYEGVDVTYDIDIVNHTLTEHTKKTDALSNRTFFIDTLPVGSGTKYTTIKFKDSDNVTVKAEDSREYHTNLSTAKVAKYTFDSSTNTLNLYVQLYRDVHISKWTYDATTETLSWKEGSLFLDKDCDATVKGTLAGLADVTFTPADASVTGNLVIDKWDKASVNGSNGTTYTLDYANNIITIAGVDYTVDWAAKTYKIVKADYTFVNNQTYTLSKQDEGMAGPTDCTVTIAFGETGKIASLKITETAGSYYNATTYDCNKTNLDYTVDAEGNVEITVDAVKILLTLDNINKTVASAEYTWSNIPTDDGKTYSFTVGKGTFTHKA